MNTNRPEEMKPQLLLQTTKKVTISGWESIIDDADAVLRHDLEYGLTVVIKLDEERALFICCPPCDTETPAIQIQQIERSTR